MKQFVYITLIFAVLCCGIGLISPQFIFLGVGLSFVLLAACLTQYLGTARGLLFFISVTMLPGLIESYGFRWGIPFFRNPVLQNFTHTNWRFALDPQTATTVMSIAIILGGAAIVAHRMRLYGRTAPTEQLKFIVLASVLAALTFVVTGREFSILQPMRWLLISCTLYTISTHTLSFTPTDPVFRRTLVGLYYFLPVYSALSTAQYGIIILMGIVAAIHAFLFVYKRSGSGFRA